jgi:FAD/FMN-containing dehydrogenase
VRYSDDARLEQIMQAFRDEGATINNPHVHILEDGGKLRDMDRAALSAAQRMASDATVAMKSRFDPYGLLNPGKLRSQI